MTTFSPEQCQQLRADHYNAEVISVRKLHPELMILRVLPDQGPPPFQPGQYTLLGLGEWEPRVDRLTRAPLAKLVRRAYSISCPMLDEHQQLVTATELPYLEFYITLVSRASDDPPMLTPRLFALQSGDRIFLGSHPHGRYLLDDVEPDDTVLYFGTGTGEAPHNTHLAELLKRGHQGRIVVATSVRYRQDLGYLTTHRELERRYHNYRYLPLTTREAENLDPARDDFVGKTYLQDLFQREDFQTFLQGRFDPLKTHAFICGNPAMIGLPKRNQTGQLQFPKPRGMIETLLDLGLRLDEPHHPGTIHFEKYW